VHLVAVPWARPGSGFTMLFEALVLTFARAMPIRKVAETVREDDTLVWRIVEHHVAVARAKEDFVDMVRRHREGILAWHHSHVSNGLLEGMNSLIQAAKARARGYRTGTR